LERNYVFKLKGLDETNVNIDLDYVFMIDHVETASFTFQGVKGLSKIEYNMTNQTWSIQSYSAEITNRIAIYSRSNFFPLGTQNWTFIENLTKLKLKLTKVKIDRDFCKIPNCTIKIYD